MALLVPPMVDELDTLGDSLEDGIRQVLEWLAEGPLNASDAQIQSALDDALERARDNVGAIGGGVGRSARTGCGCCAARAARRLVAECAVELAVVAGAQVTAMPVTQAEQLDDAGGMGATLRY